MQYRDTDNYPKAILCTTIIMGALLALCYLLKFSAPALPDEGTGGVLVNFGTSDQGMGTDYMSAEDPSMAENPSKSKPDKVDNVQPTPTSSADNGNAKIVTQSNEDAPEVQSNPKTKVNNNVNTNNLANAKKPVVNQNALYKGKKNNGTGEGDGNTNTPGNQGKAGGTTLTNNYDGNGSGNGGNLLGMPERHFINKPQVNDANRRSGRVVVSIQVDKKGNVISAQAGARGTTITDYALFTRCEQAIMAEKLNPLDNGPDVQVGNVVFVFRVN
jgi:outer membrane biosynthesis protein TonB